jgi:SPP1 gp7 family putative phage head morphogenesis protein
MTPEQLALQLRLFLIHAEKGTALLLNYEFDQLMIEVEEFLRENPLTDRSEIDDLLGQIDKRLAKRIVRFSSSVTNAQKRVIRSAAAANQRYTELSSSIFDPDKEAIQKLVGRTQDGGSLTKLFSRLQQPVRDAAKDALIDGFAAGESAQTIAARLREAADIGKVRALTIARTETNEAYRAATREFYTEAKIKQYVWMAVLDARTCVICWSLHGRVFNSNKKVFSHPNCRCTLIPFKNGQNIASGLDRFAKLEPGFQKQILGSSRFELFKGGAEISSFVGSKKDEEFGLRHFIRPLD